MKFWKMNGAGNDFILIDNRAERIPEDKLPYVAKTLCERRLSIGADGLMAIESSPSADLKMLFFNSDGSIGEMCGNGARCICRYAFENGLAGERQTVETTAGVVRGERIDERRYRIRLNDPSVIEDKVLRIDGVSYPCVYVELGSPGIPHAVVLMKGLRRSDEAKLFELGRKMRYHPAFPKGANVNFCEIEGENFVYERTWERGVEDFTYACGTGTGSAAAALTLKGLVGSGGVVFEMKGGRLSVDVLTKDGAITDLFLTGPTNVVAKGDVTDEDLSL